MNMNDQSSMTEAPSVSPKPAGLDGKALAIGFLSVTACVLFVGLLVVTSLPKPAFATGQNDRGGDYIMLTQQISNSTESIVVIDAASRRMNTYGYDAGQKKFRILQRGIPLDKLPGNRVEGANNPR